MCAEAARHNVDLARSRIPLTACPNCGRGNPESANCMCKGWTTASGEYNSLKGNPTEEPRAATEGRTRYWTSQTGWTTFRPHNWGILEDYGPCPEPCPTDGPDGPPRFNFPETEEMGSFEVAPWGQTRAERYIDWLYGPQKSSSMPWEEDVPVPVSPKSARRAREARRAKTHATRLARAARGTQKLRF